MSAFDDLVVEEWLVEFLQPGRELASVDGAHAVILCGREDKGLGILNGWTELVIGRDRCEEFSLLWVGNRTVLPNPRCAGCNLLEPEHVQQRYFDYDGRPHLGMLGEFHTHQQPAIRTALDAEATRRGDFAVEQVLANRREVVVNSLAVCLEPRVMPCRPKLAAASNVG